MAGTGTDQARGLRDGATGPRPSEACRLPPEALRWTCDSGCFDFETTGELDLESDFVAQEHAREALEFGILTVAKGQNVFVRGVRGTGRRTMVRRLLRSLRRDNGDEREILEHCRDHCYVHNFSRTDRPRLITLPAGSAQRFKRSMRDFVTYLEDDFSKLLESEGVVAEKRGVEERLQKRLAELQEPLEKELDQAGFKLVTLQQGPASQITIFPEVNGQPMPPAQVQQLVQEGKIASAYLERYEEKIQEYSRRLSDLALEVQKLQREAMTELRESIEGTARGLVESALDPIRRDYESEAVHAYLDEVIDDVIETRLQPPERLPSAAKRYGVNVVQEREPGAQPPVVEETTPNLINLLGTVEWSWHEGQPVSADYSGIRGGALLRANGGYLILDATDVLAEPGAWKSLVRTLRAGKLEIVPPEVTFFRPVALAQPEPIEVSVRVILIGDARTYALLDAYDPDFSDLFKVLADFDHEIDRSEQTVRDYARVIAQIAADDGLLPIRREGVAALVEHGARVASRTDKLTARFGRLADLAREASFVAKREGAETVDGEHVRSAVRRTKERASLPSRRFQELIQRGTIRIETSSSVVGQVNGLAVIGAGPITYGFPARITATISAGRAGLIDIEGSSSLSGSIHTKGFHILGGLLRYLLHLEHPLAFSASLAFEQSYGGIDGDSASGAETCCLLSALTGVPLRQSVAMTGAIDQHGHIQAIGGVNEKIEGFFDACDHFGLTGDQGVIIPQSNAGDLQLRPDVVEACAEGSFSVWAVETIHEALAVFTGQEAGSWSEDQGYPTGTILAQAVERAHQFWEQSSAMPRRDQDDERGAAESPDSR